MAKRVAKAKKSRRKYSQGPAVAMTMAVSHHPIYEPTADPNTWLECLWSPSLNQYVCHDIPETELPDHIAGPRKHLGGRK
jgi:hypothetical protein